MTKKTILNELENLKDSLEGIPLLDEVVAQQETIQSSKNPFLSSDSLNDLIEKRNQAEVTAAAHLANIPSLSHEDDPLLAHLQELTQVMPNEQIETLEQEEQTADSEPLETLSTQPENHIFSEPKAPKAGDGITNQDRKNLKHQLKQQSQMVVNEVVEHYLPVIEQEIRNRLEPQLDEICHNWLDEIQERLINDSQD